jgi:uncharacterized protein (DUF1684 family)
VNLKIKKGHRMQIVDAQRTVNKKIRMAFLCSSVVIFAVFFVAKMGNSGNMKSQILSKDYLQELEKFRNESEERLKKDDGWLTVVGLFWLKPGINSLGSDNKNTIILPSQSPRQLAQIFYEQSKDGQTEQLPKIEFLSTTGVTLDDKPVALKTKYPLKDDKNENPTSIKVDHVHFFLINRKNGVGVRVKDQDAEARYHFKGKVWFAPNSNFVIKAKWEAHKQPKKIIVPDILGNMNEEVSPGTAHFKIEGKDYALQPTLEDNMLFFVFRDKTSGKDTYGAARFLLADLPKGNTVTLDFNKSVNPPCAFTKYATCPMPPKENILDLEIPAGEKKPLVDMH